MTSESALLTRWSVLQKLQNNSPTIILTTPEACLLFGPDQKFFKENSFTIKKDDIISPFDLAKKLTNLGYFPVLAAGHASSRDSSLRTAVRPPGAAALVFRSLTPKLHGVDLAA